MTLRPRTGEALADTWSDALADLIKKAPEYLASDVEPATLAGLIKSLETAHSLAQYRTD